MTLKELKDKVFVRLINNRIRVEMIYRGQVYSCYSKNNQAWDRLAVKIFKPQEYVAGYTEKQAYEAFARECKKANHLL